MSQALSFQSVEFDVIQQNQQPWIRGIQIGYALGYPNPRQSIAKLYDSHADEFTDAMTAVVTLPTEGGPQETRIFSLRGCHLLAMFARTPVAKQFRRWVLDVLDKLAAEERARQPLQNTQQLPPDTPITPDQQCTLHAMVRALVEKGGIYANIWSRFNNHFRIARYCQLPQSRLSEAVDYLLRLEVTPRALPGSPLPANQDKVPSGMKADRKEAMERIKHLSEQARIGFGIVRNIVAVNCSSGGISSCAPQAEHDVLDVLDGLQATASSSLAAAYNALESAYRLGRCYGRG